jgi:hypothetical protein
MNRSMLRRSVVTVTGAAALALASSEALAAGTFGEVRGADPSLQYNFTDNKLVSNTVDGDQFAAGYNLSFATNVGYHTATKTPFAKGQGSVGVPLTFFNQAVTLFQTSGHIDTDADTAGYEIDVLGAVIFSPSARVNFPLPGFSFTTTFLTASQDFEIEGVPITTTEEAVGTLSLVTALHWGNDSLTFDVEPTAGVDADISAGVGAEWEGMGWSAGVDGSLNVLTLGMPMKSTSQVSSTGVTETVAGALNIASLSGDVGIYAELCAVVYCQTWNQELYSWNGLYWIEPVFTTSQTFTF